MGNTCFLSATLQALFQAMAPVLASASWYSQCPVGTTTGDPITEPTYVLGRCLLQVAQSYGASTSAILNTDPALLRLREAYATVNTTYHGTEQHDAAEFLTHALNGLGRVGTLHGSPDDPQVHYGIGFCTRDTCKSCGHTHTTARWLEKTLSFSP